MIATAKPKRPRTKRDASICIRAITLPVREVLDPLPVKGESFFSRFNAAWRMSTDLANWCQRKLLKHDVVRDSTMEKMPKFAPLNLYGRWTRETEPAARACWDGACGSASSIIQAVYKSWIGGGNGRNRFGVIWKGETSAATFRWPYPFICRAGSHPTNKETRLAWLETEGGRVPTVSLTLPGGRVLLRLDNGSGHRRALKDFDYLIANPSALGDTKICGRFNGGKLVGVVLRIAGKFKRRETLTVGRTATIRTSTDALLAVDIEDRPEPFVIHFGHLRGWIAAYEKRRHELAVDLKYEKRWPAKQRRRFIKAGQPRIDKQDNRLKTAIQQAAACAIGFCERHKIATVLYDDSERSFLPQFRWCALASRLQTLAGERGIAWEVADTKGGYEKPGASDR